MFFRRYSNLHLIIIPGTAIIREVAVLGNFWFVLFTLVEAKERAQAAVDTREAHEGEGEQTG